MSSIKDEQSGSMYISGQPGTGKSASINNILDSIQPNLDNLQARSGNDMNSFDKGPRNSGILILHLEYK